MAAKMRKPFISRKRRREMDEARLRRETQVQQHAELRRVQQQDTERTSAEKGEVNLPRTATVGEFAQLLDLPVVKVMAQLMKSGLMAAINDRIDFDTMAIVADELGFIATEGVAPEASKTESEDVVGTSMTSGTEGRPPIVTIMGHVDHGKTSLLDRIRSTKVAAGEHGGITQHIGAYQTEVDYEGAQRLITFLDTPGHEAFTALRGHGAQVTDIVVLVVAADDGMKPQTIEAINHAKSAHVPIIVAVTKIDLPSANIDRIKQQLTEQSLVPEDWGGDTIVTSVSSVSGEGLQQLLECIVLTADLKGYKADPEAKAQGVVVESHQEVGLGPVATVLVQNGTLKIGDILVVGQTYGKVRSMMNYKGERILRAGPSTPARVAGLQAIPQFGESFAEAATEKEARDLTEKFSESGSTRQGITDISQAIAEGKLDTFKIVLKADAQGSLEALRSSITKLQEPGVKPLIVHGGIGDISLTDIQLAQAAQAVVFGFNVALAPQIKKAAENLGVTVGTYKIIYDMLQNIEMTLKGKVRVTKVRVERGRFKVKKIFRSSKEAQILGGDITQGVAVAPAFMLVQRDSEKIAEGKVTTVQKGPEKMAELEAGQECGISVQVSEKVQEGDVIVFEIEQEVLAQEVETEASV